MLTLLITIFVLVYAAVNLKSTNLSQPCWGFIVIGHGKDGSESPLS